MPTNTEAAPDALEDGGPLPLDIMPPFFINAPNLRDVPSELSGGAILESMRRRLTWPNYAGKRVLDYGCGVRLARTIANLGLEIGRYAGVDSNAEFINWLANNLQDPRFTFAHVDVDNPLYPNGSMPVQKLESIPIDGTFDLACMFSVITHQDPDEAGHIFKLIRPLAHKLYFTAFVIESLAGYREGDPAKPRLLSQFGIDLLASVLSESGWTIQRIYKPVRYQQHAIIAI